MTSASTSKASPNSGDRGSGSSSSVTLNKRHERHSRDSRETSDSKASSCTASGRSHSHSSSRSETHQTDKTGSCRHSHKERDGTRSHRRHSHGEVHVHSSPERRRSLEVKKEVVDIDPKIHKDLNAPHEAVQREARDANKTKDVENIAKVKDEKCDTETKEEKETEAPGATEAAEKSQSEEVPGKLADNESVNGDNCKTCADQKSNRADGSLSVPEGDNNTSVKTERTSPVGVNESDKSQPVESSSEKTPNKGSDDKLKDSSDENEISQKESGKIEDEGKKDDDQTEKTSSENKTEHGEKISNKISKELEKTSEKSDIVEVHNILPESEIKKSSSPEKMGGEVSQTKAGRTTASPDKAGSAPDTAARNTVKLEKSAATPPSAKHTSSTTSTPGKVLTSTGSDGVVYAVYPTGMFHVILY